FIDHHNKPILKTIYPVCFCTQEKGDLISKEERILEINYMDLDEFLEKCSYDNVKEMVKGSLKDIL
ncbi:MAG: hypothetical protein K2F56_03635, partial [Anaeroplasmataceae bacterium]|nr:hypothetical protein [Anaeroplasmataceae bacterium]